MEGTKEIRSTENLQVSEIGIFVNCSLFLAIATVQSHATKCRKEFPDASRNVLSNMYVDDCLTCANDVGATLELQQSFNKMMERGGFYLTRWASNSKEILSHIVEQEQAESSTIDFNVSEPLKALGMCWWNT